jgi:RimJ/RimL family protein N-acetyltransferase
LTGTGIASKVTEVSFERTTWPKRTPRLEVRPATVADLRAVQEIRSMPDVAQWMPGRPTSYEEFLMRAGRYDTLERTLVLELEGVLIGDLYLHVEDAWAQAEVTEQAKNAQAEIGWCLDPAHQGHGYVTEAVRELVRTCFEDLGIRRLTAIAFADNVASLAVMERLGMRREALHVADALHRDLGWVDSVTYALLADEWRAQQ